MYSNTGSGKRLSCGVFGPFQAAWSGANAVSGHFKPPPHTACQAAVIQAPPRPCSEDRPCETRVPVPHLMPCRRPAVSFCRHAIAGLTLHEPAAALPSILSWEYIQAAVFCPVSCGGNQHSSCTHHNARMVDGASPVGLGTPRYPLSIGRLRQRHNPCSE